MGYLNAWYQVNAAVLWLEAVVVIIILLGAVLFLWRKYRQLQGRYDRLMGDSADVSLEGRLEEYVRRVRNTLDRVDAHDQLLRELKQVQQLSLQGVGMVRFNPFRDTGGDQSFAIALADAHGDGIILSSLHRRDLTRVYAKPLSGWTSTHPLTEEELAAIEVARRNHPQT